MTPSKETTAQFPPLRRPGSTIAENGAVRLGDAAITAGFPELRLPDQKVAEQGAVRLGDAAITADYPPRK